ncbi:PLCX1 protein, partial [Turnix velox]|nr:PLCX1 protein [Turnix velox]
GSHDTMTYCLDETSTISGNESVLVKLLNKCMPCIVHPIIMKWSRTQVLTVTEQLEAGVRYLDFRIAHKANDPSMNLYFVHMVYTTVTVQDILWEVLRWLETHPREVVILACRNFDGLNKRLHRHLITRIKEIFRCKLCPRNVSMRFFFPPLRMIHRNSSLKQSWRYETKQKDWSYYFNDPQKNEIRSYCSAEQLLISKGYLMHCFLISVSGKFFVAGINLTENLRYILLHPFESLKEMTLQSLPCLKIWIKKQYPGAKKECINIIAGDFIGNDDFIKDVIELNRKI